VLGAVAEWAQGQRRALSELLRARPDAWMAVEPAGEP
jgi:hypothetical protein